MKKNNSKWEKPLIENREIFEKTALACDGSAFYNSWYNMKSSAYSCGFNHS